MSATERGPELLFADTFDAAPGVELTRDALRATQRGAHAPSAYSRIEGTPNAARLLTTEQIYVGANVAEMQGGALCFGGNGAVRLDEPLRLRPGWGVRVHARLDPSVGEQASLTWMSVMLTEDGQSPGWVTGREMAASMLVRSRGAVQLFARGNEAHQIDWPQGPAGPRPVHELDLAVLPDDGASGLRAEGTLDGRTFHAVLPAPAGGRLALPRALYLHLGSHVHYEDGRVPSCFDEVHVWAVPPARSLADEG